MKIAIITPTFPPYPGGIGVVAARQASALQKQGHRVRVFTPDYGTTTVSSPDSLDVVRIKPLFRYGNAAFIPALGKQLKDFDIVHVQYPFFGGAEIVWWCRKKLARQKIKVVIHYQMDVIGTGLFKIIFWLHTKIALPRIIAAADAVAVSSRDYARQSQLRIAMDRQPQRFFEIPNGVDGTVFKPCPKSAKLLERYNLAATDRVIMFVGGLDSAHYFKGVEYLLEAAARLRQPDYTWRLMIIGEGNLKARYRDLAEQLNIGPRTIFTGYVSDAELPDHYSLADVCVLPSVDSSEAFGLVLVEAMACAKPTIASDLPGVRSVVDDQITGLLVHPRDVDDLATKLHHLLSHPDIAQRFGLAGRTKVEQRYTWEQIGKQLEKLFEQIDR